jgi:hypothetical protein
LIVAIVIACSSSSQPTPPPTPPTPTPETTAKPQPPTGRVAKMPRQHRGNGAGACDTNPKSGSARSDLQGCKSDKECKDGKHGRCNTRGGGHSLEINTCEYDNCMADADCAGGGACECEGTGNRCLTATCRQDSDCGDGGACSPVNGCFGIEGFACHTAKDECIDDDDCRTNDNSAWKRCRMSPEVGHWACVAIQCPVG